MKGKLITIEGPDGAGKSTGAKKVAAYLRAKGHRVYLTREPGGTRIGEKIREILLDSQNKEMDFKTEVLLYAAARAQILEEAIKPNLAKGIIVICDRFVDSSIAYQGYGRNLDLEFVKRVNYLTIAGCIPDLTILLDLPVREGLQRVRNQGRPDRLENEEISFHRQVREGFLKIAAEETVRVKKLDAFNPPEIVYENMIQLIERIL